MTRIGRKIMGGYVDRGVAVGVIVAQHDVYVEYAVAGEARTRIMLNRVADERIVTGRDEMPYPQTYRAPSAELAATHHVAAERDAAARAAEIRRLRAVPIPPPVRPAIA